VGAVEVTSRVTTTKRRLILTIALKKIESALILTLCRRSDDWRSAYSSRTFEDPFLSQPPLPGSPSISVAATEPAHAGLPAALWQADRTASIGAGRLRSVALLFGTILALSILRLVAYCLIARGFGGASHVLCNYDCGWYEHTARAGYDLAPVSDVYANTANWAFFPLYPLLLAAVAAITPSALGMTWAGILLSTICFAGFGTLGALYLQQGSPGNAPGRMALPFAWLGFVSLWPGDLYFAFPYSEALYALLMTASLLALTRERAVESALASAALTATRPPGVLMVPVIFADRWRYLWQNHRAGRFRQAPVTVLSEVLLPVALAPLGLFAFMAYLRWRMGDALAFIHVQTAWNRHALPPWIFLWDGLATNDWGRVLAHPARESLSLEAGVAIAGLILALCLLLRRRYAEAWLIGGTILLASSSGLQSMPRFVLSNPIVIFALYRMSMAEAGPRRRMLVMLALGLLQLLLVFAWFSGAPVLA
jgi:hypothetical protein